jgi:hypothetical protein
LSWKIRNLALSGFVVSVQKKNKVIVTLFFSLSDVLVIEEYDYNIRCNEIERAQARYEQYLYAAIGKLHPFKRSTLLQAKGYLMEEGSVLRGL